MPKPFLRVHRHGVEIVVCEYATDGTRWTAHGQVVGEFETKDEAAVLAEQLVTEAGYRQQIEGHQGVTSDVHPIGRAGPPTPFDGPDETD